MTDLENLDTYNGDAEHDMWVDFDHYENTGYPEVFNKSEIENLIDDYTDQE